MTLTLAAGPALAGDGVIEINQTKALAGGVTPTDFPGFPITIDTPGSYRLTGNVDVTSTFGQNIAAVRVDADDVDLDLNGFEIRGGVTCTIGTAPLSVTCDGSNGANAGGILSFPHEGLRIRNGTLRGMQSNAINAGANLVVEDVKIFDTTSIAISTSGIAGGLRLSNCFIDRAGLDGVSGHDAVVKGCVVKHAGRFGLNLVDGVVEGNTVAENVSAGVQSNRIVLINNVLHSNGGSGAEVGSGSTVIGNSAYDNGGDGIQLDSGLAAGTAVDNALTDNGGVGLRLNSFSGYKGNTIRGNTGGTVNGGIELGPNMCETNTTCP
jgi:hypothetical protein